MKGVYQIRNKIDGKRYIGSSIDLRKRRNEHWYRLRQNRRGNPHLQNAWNKYGEDAFEFTIIKELNTSEEILRTIETMYLRNLTPEYNITYNATKNAMCGRKHTEESRKKMGFPGKSHPRYGKRLSPEARAKMSGENHHCYGKRLSKEHRDKIGRGMLGKKAGEKHHNSKLTEEQVRFARFLKSAWDISYTKLGRYFSVAPQTVHDAVTGRTWGHI